MATAVKCARFDDRFANEPPPPVAAAPTAGVSNGKLRALSAPSAVAASAGVASPRGARPVLFLLPLVL